MSFNEGLIHLGCSLSNLEVLCFLSLSADRNKVIRANAYKGLTLSGIVL